MKYIPAYTANINVTQEIFLEIETSEFVKMNKCSSS